VQLEDDLGNNVLLKEKQPGIYQTDSLALQGIPGRSYKLKIVTAEGEQYESVPELLLKGVKIQAVYGEVQHKTDPNLFFGRDGYQFYVDSEDFPSTDNYLLWRTQCTYKFQADYKISCYYDNGVQPVWDKDTLRNCYKTIDIPQLYLLNTNELQQKEVKRIALNYEDNYTKALSFRYSLKVSQLVLGKKAFEYWMAVKKIVDAGGELYTQQPYQVANNLKNISNPDKPALGYFMAAGLSEKRIFITPVPLVLRTGKCIIPLPQGNPLKWFVNSPHFWPVFFADVEGLVLYVEAECVDCRETGFLSKPDFWID
jgi:hypothetical protein